MALADLEFDADVLDVQINAAEIEPGRLCTGSTGSILGAVSGSR